MHNYVKKYILNLNKENLSSKEKQEKLEYLQYMLNFVKPTKDSNRIGLDFKDLTEFDFVDQDSEDNEINGHLEKRFVQLHKSYFLDYLSEVAEQYPNCFYVSYLKNEDIISDEIPNNFSVLLKRILPIGIIDNTSELKKMYSEKVSPRIMNIYKLNTVYNSVYREELRFYIMSLDFIKKGQFYFSAKELNEDLSISSTEKTMNSLESIRQKCDILKQKIHREFEVEKPYVDIEEIQRHFIKAYLVRTLLMGDLDFTQKNYGFIYDATKNSIEKYIAFDYEYSFNRLARTTYNSKRNIEFIFKFYPDILKDVIETTKMFVIDVNKNLGVDQTFARYLLESEIEDQTIAEEFLGVLEANAKFLIDQYKALESTYDKNNQIKFV